MGRSGVPEKRGKKKATVGDIYTAHATGIQSVYMITGSIIWRVK